MDNNANVSKVQHGNGERSSVHPLRKIVASEWDPARLEWIWKQVQTQDYAYDDLAKDIGAQAFLGPIFDPMSAWFEVGDVGLVAFNGIIPRCQAFVHFTVWGDMDLRDMLPVQQQLFNYMFDTYKLSRITAFIPAFNKQAIRFATLTGFRYEGEMRKAFLKHGTYHNTHIYGILRDEFYRREVKH